MYRMPIRFFARLVLFCLALFMLTAPASLQAQSPDADFPQANLPYALGISLGAEGYNTRAFANVLYHDARVWKPGTSAYGPTDANGMPKQDFDLFVLDGGFAQNFHMAAFNGTYRLYFNGQANVTADGGAIQNKQYDSATNRTTANLVVTQAYPTIILKFRSTRRAPASALNTGVTKLKLMRPTSIGATTSYPTTVVFTTEFLAAHNRGSVLRFMDFTATNGNIMQKWSERNTPAQLTFFGETPGYWWQGKGAPWEYAVLLANTLHKDIWVNVPARASNAYVQNLAALLRAQLNPDLKIHVEYSNELWNFGMPQWQHISALVDQDLQANPATSINYDGLVKPAGGSTDYGVGVPRYWARRIMEISDIFRAEFGDAAMLTRVRPVFETQVAWQHWIWQGLTFLDRYYNNGDGTHVAAPRAAKTFLWGAGGSSYNENFPQDILESNATTVDTIFDGYAASWGNQYKMLSFDTYWTSAFGLKRVAYEAGPGIDNQNRAGDPEAQAAQIDPRILGVYKRNADEFFKAGGDLYITYLGVQATHGLLPYDAVLGTQPRYKQQAFDQLAAATARPAPTVGFAIPGTFNGGRYHIREDGWSTGTNDNPVLLQDSYAWVSYTVRNTMAATYTIVLNTVNSASGKARLWVDGTAIATVNAPNGGSTAGVQVTLAPGVHALRIQRAAGSFKVSSVTFR